MRTCQTCLKDLDESKFYHFTVKGYACMTAHCKECYKARVRANRKLRAKQYSDYERLRQLRPERRAKTLEYQRRRRAKHPERNLARQAVSREVKAGRLIRPDFCGHCGAECKPEAHHTDYSKPLDVLWLCFKCHREYGHQQVVVTDRIN